MGRMHAPGKGISSSALPYRRTPPSWLKTTPEDVVDQIVKLARKGLTPSQIGVTLRDSHGIPQVRFVTGNKILRILKSQGLGPSIPEDLWHLIKKAVSVRKHLEVNRKDKDSKFRLILIESRIHRLARYYKTKQQIPPTFKYDSATASTLRYAPTPTLTSVFIDLRLNVRYTTPTVFNPITTANIVSVMSRSVRAIVGLQFRSAEGIIRILPQEMLDMIIEQLRVPDNLDPDNEDWTAVRFILCKLRRVSQSFNEAASRVLFRQMLSKSGRTHSMFLRTLLKNRRLARHVRIYSTPTSETRTGHVYKYIKQCLPLMTGLNDLVYRTIENPLVPGSSERQPLPRHFPNLKTRKRPFQLINFTWHSDARRPEEDEKALEFLTTQNSLVYLRWISTRPLPPSYKEKIPLNLRYLDSSVEVLVAVLPERDSIEGVRWRMHRPELLNHLSTADIADLCRKLCRMDKFLNLTFLSLAHGYEEAALQYLCSTAESFPQMIGLVLGDIKFAFDMNLGQTFPALRQIFFSNVSEHNDVTQVKKKVEYVFKCNLFIRHVNIRRESNWHPYEWNFFTEWRQGGLQGPVSRTWELTPEYQYCQLVFEHTNIFGLNPLIDTSPF
ncbi:40S ribosomal protein S13 [Psilocybe cubensis]|uniref:40S ribosomal protein S13 n=2 Tax=Psilocybe cubensis TaxID=181762 RepID=A0ACB8GRQ7_PSICU|nr:40S ribosomal protein S13 [Psilocybe cubensis]KAH9478246.1 40S ribosomal protein S13 [Psilocybe cubensis]